MGRAWAMWKGGTARLDLNPHTGGWPALTFYVTLALQRIYGIWFQATHAGADAQAVAAYVTQGNGARDIFILARIVGAAIGVLTVALTYLLGKILAGRWVALGAGLLLAVNLPHILVSQHVSDPNLFALLFVLLAMFPMVRIARRRGSTRDSVLAGICIGLAGACKYVPMVVGVPFLLAHPRGLKNRAFWLGAVAILIALFIATPYTFLDWKTTFRDLDRQRDSLFSNWIGQSTFPISLPTYLIQSLPHAMGWLAYFLALAGAVLLWRRGRAERVVVGTAAVVILVNGMLKAAQERYVLTALPALCVAAAVAFERGWAWWQGRAAALRIGARVARAAPALAAAVALAWPLPELRQIRSTLSLPDTRHVSRRWIQANVPAQEPMVVELYGPVFAEGERLSMIWPFFATQAPLVRPAYRPEFLDGVHYIAQSSGISSRFEGDSLHYPAEVAYYRWLRTHAPLVWSSAQSPASGPTIEVRRIPASLSTRASRDSLFRALMPRPNHTTRLALWCLDMSTLFGRMGDNDRAKEWAERGLRVDAKNMNGQLQVALSLARLRSNDPAGAAAAAREAVTMLPRGITAHLYYGLALRELKRYDEALPEIRTAFMLSGDDRVRLTLGQLLVEMGQVEEAARELEAVPPSSPERGAARRDLGILYFNRMNRHAEGLQALTEAAALERNPKEAAMLRAEVARLTASHGGR